MAVRFIPGSRVDAHTRVLKAYIQRTSYSNSDTNLPIEARRGSHAAAFKAPLKAFQASTTPNGKRFNSLSVAFARGSPCLLPSRRDRSTSARVGAEVTRCTPAGGRVARRVWSVSNPGVRSRDARQAGPTSPGSPQPCPWQDATRCGSGKTRNRGCPLSTE
jgi:hypothetical protein